MIAPVDPVGGSAAREAARQELSRPGYGHGGPSVLDRVLGWIGRRLGGLFGGGTDSTALVVILVLLLAVAVVFAARAGLPGRRSRPTAGGDLLAPDAEVDHRATAVRLTAEGRHAEAVREWLRDVVRTIERRGVLPPRPGRTGATTARQAGPLLPDAAAELAAATGAFDEVWFGGRTATETDVAHARAAADAVAGARITAADVPPGLAVPW